jgi:Rrf2 family protein
VNLSARTEYACLAALDLAARYDSGEPVPVRDIADGHGIPTRFLVQILLQLKSAGLVHSTRGSSGGYQLAKAPESITLLDVVSAVDGAPQAHGGHGERKSAGSRVVAEVWSDAVEAMCQEMAKCSLKELTSRQRTQSERMYYI